jgi:hypothetical protein
MAELWEIEATVTAAAVLEAISHQVSIVCADATTANLKPNTVPVDLSEFAGKRFAVSLR